MKKFLVSIPPAYYVYIADNLFVSNIISETAKNLASKFAIIADSKISDSYGQMVLQQFKKNALDAEIFTIPSGENSKTREVKQQIEDQLLAKNYAKDSCLLAVGGGVITDLTGFIAATYYRGIPAIYCPTTLLSMVDAAIGGKTAVNTPFGKNLIGAFYQPAAVFMDISSLRSLSTDQFLDGIVETLKHALIRDRDFLLYLDTFLDKSQFSDENLGDLILRSCNIKRKIVEADPEEKLGERHILNFGHTIGHALESWSNYEMSHGQSVWLGMLGEAYLSWKSGFLAETEFNLILNILGKVKFSRKYKFTPNDLATIKNNLIFDKKSLKKIPRFVLLKQAGQALENKNQYLTVVDEDLLDSTLIWLMEY